MASPGEGRGIIRASCHHLVVLCSLMIIAVGCDPLPTRGRSLIGQTIFDVTKFGAKSDGRTDNAMVRDETN